MIVQSFSREQIDPRLPDGGAPIRLRAYLRPDRGLLGDRDGRWAVLVLPGGGYQVTASVTEGEPVALAFLNAGVQAFVLDYSVAPARYPQQLLEAAACLAFLRRNAAQYNIARVAVCGFSAGGHLAGCLANLWASPLLTQTLGGAPEDYRPDAAVLCYPVITARPGLSSAVSFENLLGPNAAVPPELSLEESVTPDNPPAFVWCTCTDGSVPMENTLLYAGALQKAGVSCETHVFSAGPHAMGLATPDTAGDAAHVNARAAQWHALCVSWLKTL